MPAQDGRKTMHQDIEHVRVNNPDGLAAIGEFTDNSESWGNASRGAIIVYETKTVIVDNGQFDPKVFPNMFTLRKDSLMNRYLEGDEKRLGKFNAGSTESVMLLGDKGHTFHNFIEGRVMKTSIDMEHVIADNNIVANETIATCRELEDFVKYQKLIDKDYSIEKNKGFGTVVIIENLRFPNTKKVYTLIKQFMSGLYDETRESNITWKLYDWTSEMWKEHPSHIINAGDLSFGCDTTIEQLYASVDSKGTKYYTMNKLKEGTTLRYKGTIKYFQLDKEHQAAETEVFSNRTDEERVGYQLRRGGRLVSGIHPKLWNISTGMSRGRGIRIDLNFPVCPEADKDFNIGTFKKVTDDSWQYFGEELQKFLATYFKDSSQHIEKQHKAIQHELAAEYREKIKNVNTQDTIEMLSKLHIEAQDELRTHLDKKKVIKKKSGVAYKALTDYITYLGALIDEKNRADTIDEQQQSGGSRTGQQSGGSRTAQPGGAGSRTAQPGGAGSRTGQQPGGVGSRTAQQPGGGGSRTGQPGKKKVVNKAESEKLFKQDIKSLQDKFNEHISTLTEEQFKQIRQKINDIFV